MISKRVTSTPTSTLPARPERPFRYICPVTAPTGGNDIYHQVENYFNPTIVSRLLPSQTPSRLYDTIARAHDHLYQVTPDMVDPSAPQPVPLSHNERYRLLANLRGDSIDYMGISPDLPEWRPRRSSYEDRRGAVGVTPSEVNSLVPYIPPIDTSMPPPSKEWLDAMAKRILSDAHADFDSSQRNTTSNVTTDPQPSLAADDSFSFDYDSDSSLEPVIRRLPVPQPSQQPPQPEPELYSIAHTDTETDTDTDTDTSSDGGYDWNLSHFPDSKWIIPRKRPSVVIVNNNTTTMTNPTKNKNIIKSIRRPKKRPSGAKSAPYNGAIKTPKRHANDTPARHGLGMQQRVGSEEDHSSGRPLSHFSSLGSGTDTALRPPVSSITATAQQMNHVRIASPAASPLILPAQDPSVPPKSPKVFPCLVDGCSQICASAGDLQRHKQSLRHRAPSHSCLACGKSYTRSDALKRHLNSKVACKKVHTTNLANSPGPEQVPAEASTKAV